MNGHPMCNLQLTKDLCSKATTGSPLDFESSRQGGCCFLTSAQETPWSTTRSKAVHTQTIGFFPDENTRFFFIFFISQSNSTHPAPATHLETADPPHTP